MPKRVLGSLVCFFASANSALSVLKLAQYALTRPLQAYNKKPRNQNAFSWVLRVSKLPPCERDDERGNASCQVRQAPRAALAAGPAARRGHQRSAEAGAWKRCPLPALLWPNATVLLPN